MKQAGDGHPHPHTRAHGNRARDSSLRGTPDTRTDWGHAHALQFPARLKERVQSSHWFGSICINCEHDGDRTW